MVPAVTVVGILATRGQGITVVAFVSALGAPATRPCDWVAALLALSGLAAGLASGIAALFAPGRWCVAAGLALAAVPAACVAVLSAGSAPLTRWPEAMPSLQAALLLLGGSLAAVAGTAGIIVHWLAGLRTRAARRP
jgi:hypothetical protein